MDGSIFLVMGNAGFLSSAVVVEGFLDQRILHMGSSLN